MYGTFQSGSECLRLKEAAKTNGTPISPLVSCLSLRIRKRQSNDLFALTETTTPGD